MFIIQLIIFLLLIYLINIYLPIVNLTINYFNCILIGIIYYHILNLLYKLSINLSKFIMSYLF